MFVASSIVFKVIQNFSLVREVQLVSRDQCLSFHHVHDSHCILSSVAFDADCLSCFVEDFVNFSVPSVKMYS